MKSQKDFLQDIVRNYQSSGSEWPTSSRTIARWAIANRQWLPKPEAVVNQCAEQIAREMAAEYFNDANGNRVRAKHAVVHPEGSVQHVLWDDIRTGEPKHLEVSFQQKRKNILYECKQLKNDADYYNEFRKPDEPVQIVFDFSLDLEEMDLAKRKRAA